MNNKRIMKDIARFYENKPENIYIYVETNNKIYAMIIGVENTPYENGYYFFELNIPNNYPFIPPTVKFLTTDGFVRFNPNLYACGKVCLSILGTWNGPPWSSAMTLTTLLVSIQSLLNEYPLRNEPGFENLLDNDKRLLDYNIYVLYNNFKLAIIDVYNNKYNVCKYFTNEILEIFNKNYNNINNKLMNLKNNIYYIENILYFKNFNIDFNILELKKLI
jgi:ubiquitin-conjugating enzyme E2 Z